MNPTPQTSRGANSDVQRILRLAIRAILLAALLILTVHIIIRAICIAFSYVGWPGVFTNLAPALWIIWPLWEGFWEGRWLDIFPCLLDLALLVGCAAINEVLPLAGAVVEPAIDTEKRGQERGAKGRNGGIPEVLPGRSAAESPGRRGSGGARGFRRRTIRRPHPPL